MAARPVLRRARVGDLRHEEARGFVDVAPFEIGNVDHLEHHPCNGGTAFAMGDDTRCTRLDTTIRNGGPHTVYGNELPH